jgi:ring-1,2-phenylacetyl-CoA epoxidase subunit PaaB
MSDTQWPRFQVFLQEQAGAAHIDVGSVHAPDAEMALFNGRDVFVRRPDCHEMWVVPAEAIFSKTREELETWQPPEKNAGAEQPAQTYFAFCKPRSAGTQTYQGTVEAGTPEQALLQALEKFSQTPPPFAWWVFPAARVVRSSPEDKESFFAPASEKTFRLSTDFHTHSAMRQLKGGNSSHEQ